MILAVSVQHLICSTSSGVQHALRDGEQSQWVGWASGHTKQALRWVYLGDTTSHLGREFRAWERWCFDFCPTVSLERAHVEWMHRSRRKSKIVSSIVSCHSLRLVRKVSDHALRGCLRRLPLVPEDLATS